MYKPKTTGTGRLNRINGPGLPNSDGGAFYGYTTNSDLVGTLTYKNTAGTAVASATRDYDDHRDLLKHVENKAGTGLTLVSKYDYSLGNGYDGAGRRTSVVYTGSANALASATRVYDDHRNLLVSIENEESGTPETISMYTYAYDGAGRRTSVVYTGSAFDPDFHVDFGYNDRGELTAADRRQGTTPGTGDLLAASPFAFDYTYDPIGNRESYQLDGGTATTYTTNEVNQYTGTADPTEYFCYDADGNLVADGKATSNCETADGTMTYVWNAENRLIEAYPTTPAANDKKVEFKYDYLGRRVEKKVSIYTAGQWVEDEDLTQRFVCDGWNVVLVLDGSGDTQRTYTWGLDLSGAMQGAGGIGGLLAVDEVDGTYAGESYWFFYDGNGNVGQLLNADDQTLAAHYEYDPYGNILVASDEDSSDYVNINPIRFSTKWFDTETGLGYWGKRYLDFELGRWANRDPIEEKGGLNLYGFVSNDPVNKSDMDGRIDRFAGHERWGHSLPRSPEECCRDAQKAGLDEGDDGGVICCEGRKIPCAWIPPSDDPSVDVATGIIRGIRKGDESNIDRSGAEW